MQAITITQITPDELATLINDSVRQALSERAPQKQETALLNIEELCEITGLAKATIYTLHSRGQIPSIKRPGGKKLLFDREQIMKYLRSGGKKTTSEIQAEALENLTSSRKRKA